MQLGTLFLLACAGLASGSQLPFQASPLRVRPDECLSCSSCATDPCQTNTPGGLLLLTSFWDYSPATGPDDSWTIHGLWPDKCDGSWEGSCDNARNHANIAQILQAGGATDVLDYMNQYWLDIHGNDNSFWVSLVSRLDLLQTCLSCTQLAWP